MGRDSKISNFTLTGTHFNPLSPHGERPSKVLSLTGQIYFNPLSPHGERLRQLMTFPQTGLFQSTLPAWGETRRKVFRRYKPHISIHSPRMGRDALRYAGSCSTVFQSTLPAWGETANAHNFSKRKTGASAQHCIFSPAKRFFLLTKNFLEKRNKPFFRCEPYRKTVGAPVSHQPLKN